MKVNKNYSAPSSSPINHLNCEYLREFANVGKKKLKKTFKNLKKHKKVKSMKNQMLEIQLHCQRDSVTRKFFEQRLWGNRLGTEDVLDPYFIVLRCPFNLLRMFQDDAHRSKPEIMLGPGSGVNLTSDPDKPHPSPCDCSVSPHPQWQLEKMRTNN